MDSLKCLSAECVNLLHKNNLLKSLIKSELKASILSKVRLDSELSTAAIDEVKSKLGITNDDELEGFLISNRIDINHFNNTALESLRLQKVSQDQFATKAESRFLERKNQLDIITYSLIRVSNWSLCRELYLKILEKEADFGEIASKYSEGIEKQSRGIIGPVPLGKANPVLAEHLRSSKIGEVSQPIKLSNIHMITRVESYVPAQLDKFMKGKMCEELFESWIERESLPILQELIKQPNSNN